MIGKIIDFFFSSPKVFNFIRHRIHHNFVVEKRIISEELSPKKGDRILDVGCGTGDLADAFSICDYVGIDLSQEYVDTASELHKGQFKQMDARRLEFTNEEFDMIFVYGLFHHLSDKDTKSVLSEIERVVKKNGKILILEDIPTRSKLNFYGKLVHYLDRGAFIRPVEEWERLLSEHININKSFATISGPCDIGCFLSIMK